jgi:hypothetical protein
MVVERKPLDEAELGRLEVEDIVEIAIDDGKYVLGKIIDAQLPERAQGSLISFEGPRIQVETLEENPDYGRSCVLRIGYGWVQEPSLYVPSPEALDRLRSTAKSLDDLPETDWPD